MDLECSDGDTTDSMEYPSDDDRSVYERRILKMKRRRERAFFSQFKQGEIVRASQLLPGTKDDRDEEFKPAPDTPRRKRTSKRRSMPAICIQPRKSQRLDGKPVSYSGLDKDFVEPPINRRRQSLGGKPRRVRMPRIVLPREVEFNPDSLSGEVCYGSQKVYSQSGTTCHQCRLVDPSPYFVRSRYLLFCPFEWSLKKPVLGPDGQKTIDLKSQCYSPYCRGVRGQFCGYCLRQRYGEDVAVVLRDPKWKCPPCRNICNCSLCRRRYGKEPTGQLFHFAASQGYANVKDYLAEKNDLILVEDDEGLDGDDDEDKEDGTSDTSREADGARITRITPKQKRPTRRSPREKENEVPVITVKEEPVDFDIDQSMYPNVDLKPQVLLEKLDPSYFENGNQY